MEGTTITAELTPIPNEGHSWGVREVKDKNWSLTSTQWQWWQYTELYLYSH